MAPRNSVDSTSDAQAENRLEVPGAGEMSRAESMYYTPDTTLEKLSEVAAGGAANENGSCSDT